VYSAYGGEVCGEPGRYEADFPLESMSEESFSASDTGAVIVRFIGLSTRRGSGYHSQIGPTRFAKNSNRLFYQRKERISDEITRKRYRHLWKQK
jgi:hypothetical protein